jgi:N-acetylneuraminic acid mutarotase
LIAFCLLEDASAAPLDSWSTKASMNHPRAYLGVAAVDDKIYAIGGDQGSETGSCSTGESMTNNAVNYTEEYDPTLNAWISRADMPTARALFGTAVYGGKIFCIGGYNGADVFTGPKSWDWKTEYYNVGANEVYDPATDTWQTLTPLPTPRYKVATNIVDGKIYVIGGHSMSNLYKTENVVEVYDPITNSWTTKTPAPLPVGLYASAVVDYKIYVLGTNPNATWQFNIMVYDPATDIWTIKSKTPLHYGTTAAATTGENALKRIYYFDENRTDIYNPTTDTWSAGTASPTIRLISKAVTVNDAIYLVGGRTGQWGAMTFEYPSNITELYLPIGYGTPDLTAPTSTPSLTPTPNPSQTVADPSNGSTHGNSETIESISQEHPFPTIPVVAVALVVPIIVFAAAAILKIRKKIS